MRSRDLKVNFSIFFGQGAKTYLIANIQIQSVTKLKRLALFAMGKLIDGRTNTEQDFKIYPLIAPRRSRAHDI